MNDRLSFLAQRNAAAHKRAREFGAFEAELKKHVSIDPAQITYFSYDATWELVEKWIRQKTAKSPQTKTVAWRTAYRSAFSRCIDCLRCNSKDEEVAVVLYQRYRFVGGFSLGLHAALKNVLGFFSMKEETIMLANSTRAERICLDWSEDSLSPTGIVFEIEISGADWPDLATPCFPSPTLPFRPK